MSNLRVIISEKLLALFELYIPGYSEMALNVTAVIWIIACAFILHLFLHKVILKILKRIRFMGVKGSWLNALARFGFFNNLVFIIQSVVVQIQVKAWTSEFSVLYKVVGTITNLCILFFGLLAVFSLLNSFQEKMYSRKTRLQVPIKGMVQTAKLVLSLVLVLLIIAILLGKSPFLLLSGLGALSAVLMLVFKDPILGLVAGVQLSANNMLMVGDWLEMPKYSADGDVIDIGLTTVKVQNWDKTITTIPTYALISDSFKNWRGMSEAGGRRIKRSILINTLSVRFLEDDDIERLKKINVLSSYLLEKHNLINKENLAIDESHTVNRRRLTNLGTFRIYMIAYLKAHPGVQQDMTLMVRQLESSHNGIPLEVYAFTNTIVWEEYESIQSDIFDHIFAIVSEFDLVIHESPTSSDIRRITKI